MDRSSWGIDGRAAALEQSSWPAVWDRPARHGRPRIGSSTVNKKRLGHLRPPLLRVSENHKGKCWHMEPSCHVDKVSCDTIIKYGRTCDECVCVCVCESVSTAKLPQHCDMFSCFPRSTSQFWRATFNDRQYWSSLSAIKNLISSHHYQPIIINHQSSLTMINYCLWSWLQLSTIISHWWLVIISIITTSW